MAWNSEYLRQRHKERRVWAIDLLGGKCARCGGVESEKDPFEFDHVVPGSRAYVVSNVLGRWSLERLKTELVKCQLLHMTCHHAKSQECGETGGGKNKIINPPHGTWAAHTRDGCRCDECRRWKRQYKKNLVDARGRPRTTGCISSV